VAARAPLAVPHACPVEVILTGAELEALGRGARFLTLSATNHCGQVVQVQVRVMSREELESGGAPYSDLPPFSDLED
jgi:hypothetical protein